MVPTAGRGYAGTAYFNLGRLLSNTIDYNDRGEKMSAPKVFVSRIIAQEALDSIARATEMEVWPEE